MGRASKTESKLPFSPELAGLAWAVVAFEFLVIVRVIVVVVVVVCELQEIVTDGSKPEAAEGAWFHRLVIMLFRIA